MPTIDIYFDQAKPGSILGLDAGDVEHRNGWVGVTTSDGSKFHFNDRFIFKMVVHDDR